MSVYLTIPSARPLAEAESCFDAWHSQGYSLAALIDPGSPAPKAELIIERDYPGYALSVNWLIADVLSSDPECNWCVTGGDDTWPDRNLTALTIAEQCEAHFGGTYGVMQPVGDWDNWKGSDIRKIAGSAWLGREFCERVNQGRGPLWPEYWQLFEDEELQQVALRLGVFWQRPDLTHYHQNWARPKAGERMVSSERMPEFLKRANSQENWRRMKALFESRKTAGFPGSEPLP
jgi:hypothetical protein